MLAEREIVDLHHKGLSISMLTAVVYASRDRSKDAPKFTRADAEKVVYKAVYDDWMQDVKSAAKKERPDADTSKAHKENNLV